MPTRQVAPKAVIPARVWRAYVDDDFNLPERFIFTTNPEFANSSTDPDTFDVRDLDVPSAYLLLFGKPPLIDADTARLRGMSLRRFQRTPEYLELVSAWEIWFDETEPRLIRRALREWLSITTD